MAALGANWRACCSRSMCRSWLLNMMCAIRKTLVMCPMGIGDPEGHFFHRLYPVEALRSMLKECDFVVVAVPLTAETQNLIGEEELRVMKSSAYSW
jgi:hypothetical protein